MKTAINSSRREFLKGPAAIGSGLVVGCKLPSALAKSGAGAFPAREIDAWVVVRTDDTVVIRNARSEMDQGSFTSLPRANACARCRSRITALLS